jgi:gliding motility-associated-like protein
LICNIDTLRLEAQGQGQFSWTPNYMISSTTAANPLVSPDLPTRYYVTLTSAPGCSNMDSVFVDVKQFVTVNAGADTTICLSDSLKLKAVSDGLQFQWTPSATLINPNSRDPVAIPTATLTTYRVTANIGKCQSTDDIQVRTVPYPLALASQDTAICRGDTARLRASGGSSYVWTPSASLNESRSPSPLAFPTVTTRYTLMVFDNKGCPKAGIDSVIVQVKRVPNAFAGNDTAIVIGQTLQLQATGGTQYSWSPPNNLNNPNIPNPRASLTKDSRLVVAVTLNGCTARDTINIKVFATAPDIFVPTAFTPNNDKRNDQLIPIPVGISSFDFFRVYNRFGELVFSANTVGKGWDGRIQGKEQNTGTFTWYVQGTDFTGKRIFKKGTSTLIR